MRCASFDEYAISAAGLGKRYGQQWVLDGVDVQVPAGAVTGVVGPNGSGKSTMLSCLVGIERPTAGSIDVYGYPAGTDEAKRLVSYTPDDLPMPALLTGAEYLRLICQLEGRARDLDRAVAFAELFSLSNALTKLIGSYSHGMRRRLQFAAAVSSEAHALVMDEPFSGLDVEGSYLLRSALADWARSGRTVLLTVHDLAAAERECGHVIVLSAGRVVAAGVPRDLLRASASAVTLEELVLELSGTLTEVRATAHDLGELVTNGIAPLNQCATA